MADLTCSVDGCGRCPYARGYCNRHWQRWRKLGEAPTADGDQPRLREQIPCRSCGATERKSGQLFAFCSMACYHRFRRSGEQLSSGTCCDCGAQFSYQDVGTGGRRQKRDTRRCPVCRDVWHTWCMTAAELAARDGANCAIGGEPIDMSLKFPHPDAPTVDHIYPRARGGADVPDNLQLACWHHNRQKSDRLPDAERAAG